MPLVVIEGLDGAGKSTQIEWLRDYFSRLGKVCRYVHFPRTDAPVYGALVSRFLRGELGDIHTVNPYLVALIYAGDRLDFKPVLQQWLMDEGVVLLDRYVYSNVAYQCAKLPAGQREDLCRWILDLEFGYHGLPVPDATLFLDVPFRFTAGKLAEARQGVDRDYLMGKQDIHEADLDFQRQVQQVYSSLAGSPGFVRIDCADANGAMLPPAAISDKILQVLGTTRVIS